MGMAPQVTVTLVPGQPVAKIDITAVGLGATAPAAANVTWKLPEGAADVSVQVEIPVLPAGALFPLTQAKMRILVINIQIIR